MIKRLLALLMFIEVACQTRQDKKADPPPPKPTTTAQSASLKKPASTQAASTQATSASAPTRATLTTTPGTISTLLAINPEIIPSWSLSVEKKMVFALHILGPGDLNPVIFTRETAGWSVTSFADDFHGHAWQDALYIAKTKTIMGILDFEVESPGPQLEIFTSSDGGRSWSQSTIEKPYYLARFLHAEVFPDGAVRLNVTLDDDYGSGNKPGLYQYLSTDQGATWTPPTFSPTIPTITRKGALGGRIKTDKDLDAIFP
jgi:hypothetical protein